MQSLPLEFAVSAAMFVLTTFVHLVGLDGVTRVTRWHLDHALTGRLTFDRLSVAMGMALGLFAVHGLEVMAYAVFYQVVDASETWTEAVAASLLAYSTAGAIGLEGWRVVGSGESLNGILLLGWSTAFLFQSLHRITTTEEEHPFPVGAIVRRTTPREI